MLQMLGAGGSTSVQLYPPYDKAPAAEYTGRQGVACSPIVVYERGYRLVSVTHDFTHDTTAMPFTPAPSFADPGWRVLLFGPY